METKQWYFQLHSDLQDQHQLMGVKFMEDMSSTLFLIFQLKGKDPDAVKNLKLTINEIIEKLTLSKSDKYCKIELRKIKQLKKYIKLFKKQRRKVKIKKGDIEKTYQQLVPSESKIKEVEEYLKSKFQ